MGIGLANIDIGGLFSGIGTLAKDLRAAITGKEPIDATKAAELALKAEELQATVINAQNAVNLAEASNSNLFVSGWRPAAGWVCVLGLLYSVFLRPMISYFSSICGLTAVPPVIDTVILLELLFGMLGLGGLRSWDKKNGAAS
jgi:hypothetical protein